MTKKALTVLTLCSLALTAITSTTSAGEIDPRGIYFNSFSGQFSGTEWFQVIPGSGENQFLMTDVRGGGFTTTVTADGTISFPNGSGSFSDPDNFVLFPFGGAFTFDNNRVPFTDVNFPLQLQEPPHDGDPILAGEFESTTQFFNPQTGAFQGGATEEVDISVNGTTLRITDPAGLFFQGVFTDDMTVAFRDIDDPNSSTFASFPGSIQNVNQDMLGELEFSDVNNFTATILLQTLEPLGSEDQTLVRFTAARIDPMTPGDLDNDGDVDGADLGILLGAFNTSDPDSDLNNDGTVDGADLGILLGNWG